MEIEVGRGRGRVRGSFRDRGRDRGRGTGSCSGRDRNRVERKRKFGRLGALFDQKIGILSTERMLTAGGHEPSPRVCEVSE